MTLYDAIRVLNAANHRGARCWYFDVRLLRVMPLDWNGLGLDPAPSFTAFEALSIARDLARIGAGGCQGESVAVLGPLG